MGWRCRSRRERLRGELATRRMRLRLSSNLRVLAGVRIRIRERFRDRVGLRVSVRVKAG